MPQLCKVCNHAERAAIDASVIEATANQRIVTRYGFSEGAVRRHKANHLSQVLAQAVARAQSPHTQELIAHAERVAVAEVAHGDDLLARLATMTEETLAILRDARGGERKDNELALKAIARIEKQAELVAKLRGMIVDGAQTVNVMNITAGSLAGMREALIAKLAGSTSPSPMMDAPSPTERALPSAVVIDAESREP